MSLSNDLNKYAKPFEDVNDLSPIIDKMKDKDVVMIGEATHGTSEFYRWRAEISKKLIKDHGFNYVAIEGDWPDTQRINKYMQQPNKKNAREVLRGNNRWPTWMWANEETAEFIEWLKNKDARFFGLDIYSFYDSVDAVLRYIAEEDPDNIESAKRLYSCMEPYWEDEKEYARSLFSYPEGCKKEIQEILKLLLQRRLKEVADQDALFSARQNAQIASNAEDYYRNMVLGGKDTWNIRDEHMMETLELLQERYGKGVVWAHNTHIGDYRATNMVDNDNINLGGLAREKMGEENVYLLGFSTYEGSVVASEAWGAEEMKMPLPKAREGSYESEFHDFCSSKKCKQFYLDLNDETKSTSLNERRGHRAIGVVYRYKRESLGQYVPTYLAPRYDGLLHIDKTNALHSLHAGASDREFPETYPSSF